MMESPSARSWVVRVLLLAMLLATTGFRPWHRRHLEDVCRMATELAPTGAVDRDFGPDEADEVARRNFERLVERLEERRRPAPVLELLDRLAAMPAAERRPVYESEVRRATGNDEFSCPALTAFHLPRWAGDDGSLDRDLHTLCVAGRVARGHSDRAEAVAAVIGALGDDGRWHSVTGRQLARRLRDTHGVDGLRLILVTAESAELDLPREWCDPLLAAWGWAEAAIRMDRLDWADDEDPFPPGPVAEPPPPEPRRTHPRRAEPVPESLTLSALNLGSGAPDEGRLRRLIYVYDNEIRDCFRQAGLGAGGSGSLTVRWRLDGSGRTTDVEVLATSPAEGPTRGCVRRRIDQWQLPPPSRPGAEITAVWRYVAGDGR